MDCLVLYIQCDILLNVCQLIRFVDTVITDLNCTYLTVLLMFVMMDVFVDGLSIFCQLNDYLIYL